MFSVPSQTCENRANVWEKSREDQFLPARELPQTFPRFSPGYEGTENIFYFFIRLLVSDLTEPE